MERTPIEETRYMPLIRRIRQIYQDTGSDLLNEANAWPSLNPYYCSDGGKVELVFYDGSVQELRTPEGSHPVLGSRWYSGDATEKAFGLLVDELGLVEVKPIQHTWMGDIGPTYEVTRMPEASVTEES